MAQEGSNSSGILAVLVVVVLIILAAVLYFGGVFPAGEQSGTDIEADINIEQPASEY